MRKKILAIIILIISIIIIVNIVSGELERRRRSTAERFFQEGVYRFNEKQFMASIDALERALSTDPTYYKARYWLGKAYLRSGQQTLAIREWERALNSIGDDPLLKLKISLLFYQIGQQDDVNRFPFEDNEENPPKLSSLYGNYVPTTRLEQPEIQLFRSPVSINIDDNGNIWVAGYTSNNIVVYDKNSKVIDTITQGDIPFNRPYDIVMNSKGEIYISDFGNDRIHKYSAARQHLFSFGTSGLNNGEFYGPQGLTIDEYDNLYVVDSSNHRVQKFNPQGEFILAFGKKGNEKEEMYSPNDVVVIKTKIYVTDTKNHRIQVYDLSGNWLESLGEDSFKNPKGMNRISDNELLVADSEIGIIKFSLNPVSTKIILKNKQDTEEEKGLKRPVDIALDGNQFLYIADIDSADIPIYVPEKVKYNNLDVAIKHSSIYDFPIITHKIHVKDQSGKPIFGLRPDNFRVSEQGVLHQIKMKPEHSLKKGLSLVILNEKSEAMKPHIKELEQITRQMLKTLNPEDRVEVINYNEGRHPDTEKLLVIQPVQPFISNFLSPLDAILNKGEFKKKKVIGPALYKGISDAFSDQSYIGAVIILSSGEMTEDDFSDPDFDVCLNYAKNNDVPVYVLSFFSDGDNKDSDTKDLLTSLSKSTGGKYYNIHKSNEIAKFTDRIRKTRNSVYYVQYNSKNERGKGYKWREVKVEINLKDLFGHDKSGYFTPQP